MSAAPNSTTAEIAAAKNSALIMVVPMANFIGRKIEHIRGKPTGACPQTGADLVAPFAAPCLASVQIGGTRTVKTAGAARAVEITTVTAAHDSTVPRELLSDAERKSLEADNVSLTLGPSERLRHQVHQWPHRLPVRRHRPPRRDENARQRISQGEPDGAEPRSERGDSFAGAYAVNELVRPAAVIASHVNEGATDRRQGAAGLAHRRVHVDWSRAAPSTRH